MRWSCRRGMISISEAPASRPPRPAAPMPTSARSTAMFTSALYGRANGYAAFGAAVGGTSTFASDVSLRARDRCRSMSGNAGSTVTVGGNLTLSANADGVNAGDSASAGLVELVAFDGGSLSVTGSTNLSAVGTGGFSSTAGLSPRATAPAERSAVESRTGGDMTLGGTLVRRRQRARRTYWCAGSRRRRRVRRYGQRLHFRRLVAERRGRGRSQGGWPRRRPIECFSCGGVGGIGDGGMINVGAHTDTGTANTLAFGSNLAMQMNGYGGQGVTGAGGTGLGGNGNIVGPGRQHRHGRRRRFDPGLWLWRQCDGATGNGGDGFGGGFGGGNVHSFAADGGLLQLNGNFTTIVDGYGGQSAAGTGGLGTGGLGQLYAEGGGVATVAGFASISAFGNGGGGLTGGVGTGGRAYFSTTNGGNLSITGFAELWGAGQRRSRVRRRWRRRQRRQCGSLCEFEQCGAEFRKRFAPRATGRGGGSSLVGATSGDGFGGTAFLQAIAGGTLTVAGTIRRQRERIRRQHRGNWNQRRRRHRRLAPISIRAMAIHH